MEINEIIGKNLAELRKKNNMTQREVAFKLDFSDKSVSKWESGESMPSVDVLCKLAKLYNVKLDYFVNEEHEKDEDVVIETPDEKPVVQCTSRYRYSRLIISLLSILVLWVAAVCVFVFTISSIPTSWISFVWALPASFILAIIFNSLWGKVQHIFVYISFLLWTTLGALFVQLVVCDVVFWQIFLIGVPLQLAVILSASLILKNKSHDPATIRAKREYKKEMGEKRKEKLAKREERLAKRKAILAKKEQIKQEKLAKKQKTDEEKQEQPNDNIDRQIVLEDIASSKEEKPVKKIEQPKFKNKTKTENIIQDLNP